MKIYHRYIGYIKNYGPWLSVPKGNDKSEILFAKIFSLKQKQIKCFQLLYKKSNFDSLKKVYGSFRQGITMEKCKTKAIQANLGIFTHIQEFFGHIHAYLEPSVTLTYLEPWYIQNQKNIQNHGVFRSLTYSKLWHIQNPVKHGPFWWK